MVTLSYLLLLLLFVGPLYPIFPDIRSCASASPHSSVLFLMRSGIVQGYEYSAPQTERMNVTDLYALLCLLFCSFRSFPQHSHIHVSLLVCFWHHHPSFIFSNFSTYCFHNTHAHTQNSLAYFSNGDIDDIAVVWIELDWVAIGILMDFCFLFRLLICCSVCCF